MGSYYVFIIIYSLTTTGFGDYHAYNVSEMVISCFALVTGAAVFAYMISNKSMILKEYDVKEYLQREKLSSLKTFCV